MNKKIYIGIGLLVGGFLGTFILFDIFPLLILATQITALAGIVLLIRGVAEGKKAGSGAKPAKKRRAPALKNTPKAETELCVRCGKKLSADSASIFKIDGNKYCSVCKAAIEREIKSQHTKCSVCGVDLPIENMHMIDGTLICHSCYLKKYGNVDLRVETVSIMPIDKAVASLRKKIAAEIKNNPAEKYQLASLLWQEAASCFPESTIQYDGAWFMLNLKTGKLFAEVSTYPNQFGACYEKTIPLSAAEFNRIARQHKMRDELCAFKTDEDWMKLLDALKGSVKTAGTALQQKKEEERKSEEQKKHAVKIARDYQNRSPQMNISGITMEITQRFADRSVKVTNENGKYRVAYVRKSSTSLSCNSYSKQLSSAEAAWLEKQVEITVNDPDRSTWQSLQGGDTMNIVIKYKSGKEVFFKRVSPIRKYSDLQNKLEDLAQYGSRLEDLYEAPQ